MNVTVRRHIIPMIVGMLFGALSGLVFYRPDVLTFGSFRLDPPTIASAQEATLIMSVAWHRMECELTIQAVARSADGKKSFPIEGPHVAKMQGTDRILIDKPRKIQFPVMPPGEYTIGFEKVDGKCWPWERWFPIHNMAPKPFRFAVK